MTTYNTDIQLRTTSAGCTWACRIVMVAILLFIGYGASAQSLKRGSTRKVTSGILIDKPDSVEQARLDSLFG